MKNYQPYKYWTRTMFRDHFTRQLNAMKNPQWVWELLIEALESEEWNPSEDFDGCSIVQDRLHPCLACFVHDFHWRTGRGGAVSDKIFYDIMLLDGTPKGQAKRRKIAVRIGWVFWHSWKHYFNRNVNDLTYYMNMYKLGAK